MPSTAQRPKWIRATKALVYLAVCGVAVAAGLGMYAVGIGKSRVVTEAVKQMVQGTAPETVFDNKDAVNILLLGCDVDLSPGGRRVLSSSARSDMMLVARIDFRHKRITGISIPRDVLVAIPGHAEQKINAYHAIGGKEHGNDWARQAAEMVVGQRIDRVVEIDYRAFQEMVDMVGGVDVFINKPLRYSDRAGGLFINLKPGRRHLNGYDAMGFVRYRHGDSDFNRQQRQKDFLFSFKESVFHHWTQIGNIADKAVEMMGGGLTPREVAALALFSKKIGNDNIKMGQVPVIESEPGARVYTSRVDHAELRKTLRQFHFLDDEPTTVSESR